MAKTEITLKLEQKRNSPEVQAFKQRVLIFLNTVNASDEIKYKLRTDLAKKIDMPFYKDTGIKIPNIIKPIECAKEYVKLLIEYNNNDFTNELFSWLTKQQNQTLRKLHIVSQKQKDRKKKYPGGVMEHPVPANYSRNMLLTFIKNKQFVEACDYLDFMSTVPQIYLTRQEDELVNAISKDDMPNGWNWKTDDPFIRYVRAGIPCDIYR